MSSLISGLRPRFSKIWIHPISSWVATSGLIFFAFSSLRHLLFRSTAFDLGYFDQALYLISQGKPPVVSFWGYHVLGGHGDLILYPLSLLYKIYPSVYWLFAVQAGALAIATLPLWHLARQAGLGLPLANAVTVTYLFYPTVFQVNLFDFHPEVIALPLLLTAVLAARQRQMDWFLVCVGLVLGCRAALSLTVVAMGIWLMGFEKRRSYGAIALIAGIVWFLIVTLVVIPAFRPDGVEAVVRYPYLGNSLPEILRNLVLQPGLWLSRLVSLGNLQYLVLLVLPVIWGLAPRHLAPLLVVIPQLGMNLLSTVPAQRSLAYQYSVPIVPFLLLAVIASLAAGEGWLQQRKAIVSWVMAVFFGLWGLGIALSGSAYPHNWLPSSLAGWQATREAIALIPPESSVLTDNFLAPQLTHRSQVRLLVPIPVNAGEYNYTLLNLRHPWEETQQWSASLVSQLLTHPEFKPVFQRDEVYLFQHFPP